MLIAKRVFKRVSGRWGWWDSETCCTHLCADRLAEVFDIPENVVRITVTLSTKSGPQRVRVKWWAGHFPGHLGVVERGVLGVLSAPQNCYRVGVDGVWELKKSKRKIFYAEVSWEE